MNPRLLLMVVAATAALVALAGCGSDDGGSSTTDPATLAPPRAPLYIEAAVRPEGELKKNVETLAETLVGIDDLGGLIVSELESSASDSGEELDFEKEVEPWLGEKGGMFFQRYDGEDFTGYGVAIQTTDTAATQDFIDKQSEQSDDPFEDGSYEGVDYKVESDDGTTVGIVGDFVAIGEDEQAFKQMVDASGGESLAGEEDFANTFGEASSGSLTDVFVDIGGLIDQSGDTIDPDAKQFLESAGIEADEATAVMSLIPGSDRIELEVTSDAAGKNQPTGDASALLESLPGDSIAAFAAADFGSIFGEALDQVDATGVPGQLPPKKLKSTLKEAGIDAEEIADSVEDLGAFVEGQSASDLAGAVVLTTTDSQQATNTVANIGTLLRSTGAPGVTAISGEASGFSIRDPELGDKPLVIAAKGERIAIAYGLPAATRSLATSSSATLADSPAYKEAVSALGSTPIDGFVDGPAAVKLAAAMIPADEQGEFREAKPYLDKVDYVAIGSSNSGDLSTVKLIAGVGK
jgi:hypothetical protein